VKKSEIRVFFVLILTLVMVICSVGVVEAAKPVHTMGWIAPAGGPGINVITRIPNSPSPGLYQPACKFYYTSYKAWGYKYQWYKSTGAGPSNYYPIDEMQYVPFEGKRWQDIGTELEVTGPDGQTFGYLERYKVEVWLIKNSSKEIRNSWITAGLGSF